MVKVNQHWRPTHTLGYRQWMNSDHIIRQGTQFIQDNLEIELSNRKICYSDKKDIIRWGYEARGTFTTKEAYNLIIRNQIVKDPLWNKVWTPIIWPKVSTFLWLLCQNKILTWDNLQKRSFHGPSMCPNCKQAKETTKHLINSGPLANRLWEKVSFRCQKDGRVKEDIPNTVRTWAINPYKSKLLNTLWKLIPGFLMWIVWKERSHRIFKDQSSPLEVLWNNMRQNLRETLML